LRPASIAFHRHPSNFIRFISLASQSTTRATEKTALLVSLTQSCLQRSLGLPKGDWQFHGFDDQQTEIPAHAGRNVTS